MFGLNEALMSFIRRQVGLRTDAASASGSLHAKLGELRSWVNSRATNTITAINTVQKPRGNLVIGNFSTSESDYVTALNINGTGRLVSVILRTGKVIIRVDGVNLPVAETGSNDYHYIGFFGSHTGPYAEPYNIDINFKQSLVINLQRWSSSSSAIVRWAYEIE